MARVLIIILIIASFLLNIYFIVDKIKTYNKDYYTVTKVIDGDSFYIDSGAEVRILGINAPEKNMCGWQEAKDVLEKFILGKKVKVSPTASDSFRRLVADVYLDNKSINNAMIVSGWAVYDSSDSLNSKDMQASGQNARTNKLGVYSQQCSQTTPPNPKCAIKANINDTFGDKIYYTPDCGARYDNITVDLFRGDQWFCSEQEAQSAGFSKSKVCS